jgi:hypothetical protein
MENDATRQKRKVDRLDRFAVIAFALFVGTIFGTLLIFLSVASPHGGPEAMFDGFFLIPLLAIGGFFAFIFGIVWLSCAASATRLKRELRERYPQSFQATVSNKEYDY